MINDNEPFVCNNVLYADILGFSELTLKNEEKAKTDLIKFRKMIAVCFERYDKTKIFYYVFSDHIIAGFKDFNDALSFSKTLFNKAFYEEIHLRGTIGIGKFYQVKSGNGLSLEIGSCLVLATFAEEYHVKGHTLLLVCETKHKKHFENSEFGAFDIEKLPNEYTSYIVRWWEDDNKLNKEIDNRTCGLSIEKLKYFIATKENIERVPKKYHPWSDTW